MNLRQLADLLGEPPAPSGDWAEEAVFLSSAALRRRVDPAGLAAAVPGATALPNGVIRIVLAEPWEVAGEVFPVADQGWADVPRTWDNPGFVVKYARFRAVAVGRWARALGVPPEPFEPRLLSHARDRAVLRVLAELPGRRVSRDPGWAAYLVRLASAYHDAFEQAAPLPQGDEAVAPVHTARVRLAGAVQKVLPGPDRI
ncbi:anticodon-binding protein [Nonomuraea typhae]|uniref:anticodon-binding protein n=1 Tax=Nonomuraea typhae TaxID=2603600 RepID=UPI0012F986B3|nr:anticodon-binding protein [Nonomuraea typhae]